jgi:hypothetical protein
MTRRMAGTTVAVRIVGDGGPGRSCPGPDGIALGIQREKSVLDAVPSSSEVIRFDAGIEVVQADGTLDFRGPYVHGPKGERFLYLAWVGIRDGELVARIKLRLHDIDPGLLDAAARDGGTLVATVPLVNAQGKPASGSVRPPLVQWSLVPTTSPA